MTGPQHIVWVVRKNIHEFVHLQGVSREMQQIDYVGLWRFSSYVWENTVFPLEDHIVNVLQGMIFVRFKNGEESLLLIVAVRYTVRGLKGLTTL